MSKKLLTLCMTALFSLVGTSAWALNVVDGVYQIGTVGDLLAFAELVNGGENYSSAVLTADIDCGTEQFSIGSDKYRFNGTFDGKGHTVTVNFFPEGDGENLFRNIGVGGQVCNLIVDGAITTGKKEAAGIAGWNQGVIANCASLITIYSNVGGDATHGGIVGVASGGAIINCLSAYKVKGADGGRSTATEKCGGIAGWCDTRTTMRNNLFVGDIDLANTGGCGSISRNSGTIQNDGDNKGHYLQNFYVQKIGDTGKGVQVTEEQLASGEVCYKLNAGLATPQWTQNPGDAYPMPFPNYGEVVGADVDADCMGKYEGEATFTFGGGHASEQHELVGGRCQKCGYFDFMAVPRDVDGYYLLSTADDCRWYNWRRYYGRDEFNARLTNDIDISELPYFTNNDNWCGGDFDGAGHTLTIALTDEALEPSDANENGFKVQPFGAGNNCLFHNLSGSVHDLVVTGTIFSTGQYAGTITNHLRGDNVKKLYRVYSDVEITSTRAGDNTHGGLVGVLENNSIIEDVVFAGSVTNTNGGSHVGGLIGWSGGVCQLTNALQIASSINVSDGDNQMISRNPANVQSKNVFFINNYPNCSIPETAKEIEDESVLEDGSLTYLFNGDQSVINWTQTLGVDLLPLPLTTHKQVYAVGDFYCDGTFKGSVSYTNTAGASHKDDHSYDDGLCTVCGTADYDYLKPNADGKYEVATAAQLINISQTINHKEGMLGIDVVLTADIDMEEFNVPFEINAANVFGIDEVTKGFEPFGVEGKEFSGTFDGQFHTISNLHIYREGRAVGLLGAVAGMSKAKPVKVENVVMDNTCSIYGGAYVGLIGMSADVSGLDYETNHIIMNNVGVDCDILADGANAGGIIGCCMGGQASFDITNCYTTGHIKGGKESSAMTGWFGSHATCTSCWTISVVEGVDSDDKYFGRFDGAPTLKDCFTLNGSQEGVGNISEEEVKSGMLAWKLNGKQFKTPTWYQDLDNDEHPVVLPSHPVVAFLADGYKSITEDNLEDVIGETQTWESEMLAGVVATQSKIDAVDSYIDELSDAKTVYDFAEAIDSLNTLKGVMDASAKVYAAYIAKCEAVQAYLSEHDDFAGEDRDALEYYLDEVEEPSDLYPLGTYNYIVDEHVADDADVAAETARVDEMLTTAIANGYMAGTVVTNLVVNPDFSEGNKGWEGTGGDLSPKKCEIEGKTIYGAEVWNNVFDRTQVVEGLKPGLYLVAMNAACRPSNDRYTYNYVANYSANGITAFFPTVREDIVLANDTVDQVNCNLHGGVDDLAIYADDVTTSGEDVEIIGYACQGQLGMACAINAGRYLNYIMAEVGEDGKLTINIQNPGSNYGSDWTGFGNLQLTYYGLMADGKASNGIKLALDCMLERVTTVLDRYEFSDVDPVGKAPNYPEELKAALTAAKAKAEKASTDADKMAVMAEISDIMKGIYEGKQAYKAMHGTAMALENVLAIVAPIISDDDYQAIEDDLYALYDAYSMGSYSTEEAKDPAVLKKAPLNTFVPVMDKDGVAHLSTPFQFAFFGSQVMSGNNEIDAVLDADIDLSIMEGMPPLGEYRGVLDGQGHKLTLDIAGVGEKAALFTDLYGTVKNLQMFGNVYSDFKYAASVCGDLRAGTIDNVATYMTITSGVSGDGTHGGLMGRNEADNGVVNNCLVATKFMGLNTECWGGICGWAGSKFKINNTLVVLDPESEINANGSNTISRNPDNVTISNTYYTISVGDAKGTYASAERLKSGEITYLLNGSSSEDPAWFQTLGVDTIPQLFKGGVVYNYGGSFVNEKPNIQLNAYAYNVSAEAAAGMVKVNYTLNAEAAAVEVNFYKDGKLLCTVPSNGLSAGKNTLSVSNKLLGAQGTKLTYDVKVTAVGIPEGFGYQVGEGVKAFSVYGMAINNNPQSKGFGTLYAVESRADMKASDYADYISAEKHGALFAFDPAFEAINSADGTPGFEGGLKIGGAIAIKDNAEGNMRFDLKTLRMSQDGRLFVGRASGTTNSPVYEINTEDLNQPWTPVFAGGELDAATGITFVGDEEQSRAAVSMAIEGTGKDMKMWILGGARSDGQSNVTDYNCLTYDLGTTMPWTDEPTDMFVPLSDVYTATPGHVAIESDGRGGLWYIQKPDKISAETPSIKHFNAAGVEDYSDITLNTQGAGIAVSADGKHIAMAQGSNKVVVFTTDYTVNAVGRIQLVPVVTLQTTESSVTAMAFDYANNLYVASSGSKTMNSYAIPSWTGNKTVTPAAAGVTVGAAGKQGDVNGDGKVDVSDVVAVYNIMASGENNAVADVNNDGEVNVADVVAVYNIMAANMKAQRF